MQDTPVYLVTGFLESGKTKFIQETLQDPRFGEGERVLVIACEEGEEELDPTLFATQEVFYEVIEDSEDMSPELFIKLQKKHASGELFAFYKAFVCILQSESAGLALYKTGIDVKALVGVIVSCHFGAGDKAVNAIRTYGFIHAYQSGSKFLAVYRPNAVVKLSVSYGLHLYHAVGAVAKGDLGMRYRKALNVL